jgi:predicted phosphoribosyltransferase
MFKDRIQAGSMLASRLKKYVYQPGVVLAVPRGGVPVAYAVAKELGMPLDIILTKKIGHPDNKEYAIGAASLNDYFIIPHEDVSEEYVQKELKAVRSRLAEMYKKFMGETQHQNLEGKLVIVIDDGIATGNTLLGTVRVLQKSNPAKIVVGVPVASRSGVELLSQEVDEVIAVLIPEEFHGVGSFYENFEQVSDEEVMFYLDKLNELRKAG